jgi:uncharacterized protein (DUF1697 family)
VILLLRAINVGRGRKVPMSELRALLPGAVTYLQSGNVRLPDDEIDVAEIERALADRFGFRIDVVTRSDADWRRIVDGCPFPDAASERANLLHVALARIAPPADAAERLADRCAPGERVAVVDDALWIDYGAGVARSKLTPTVLDRTVGAPVTARNWRTAQALLEL